MFFLINKKDNAIYGDSILPIAEQKDYLKKLTRLWNNYIKNPNEETAQELLVFLPDTNNHIYSPDVPDYESLKKAINNDYPRVLEIIFEFQRNSTGVDKEFLNIQAGYYLEVNPKNFLEIASKTKDFRVTDYDWTLDSDELTKEHTSKMINALENVKDNNFINLRDKLIKEFKYSLSRYN